MVEPVIPDFMTYYKATVNNNVLCSCQQRQIE